MKYLSREHDVLKSTCFVSRACGVLVIRRQSSLICGGRISVKVRLTATRVACTKLGNLAPLSTGIHPGTSTFGVLSLRALKGREYHEEIQHA